MLSYDEKADGVKQRLHVKKVSEEKEEDEEDQSEEEMKLDISMQENSVVGSKILRASAASRRIIEVDPVKIGAMKVPLLEYIYFTFLESEKLNDEFNKYVGDLVTYIRGETHRITHAVYFSDEFYDYLNQLLFVLSALKKVIAASLGAVVKPASGGSSHNTGEESKDKKGEEQDVNKEIQLLSSAIISKPMVFLKEESYLAAITRTDSKRSRITSDQCEDYKKRWKMFRLIVEGNSGM